MLLCIPDFERLSYCLEVQIVWRNKAINTQIMLITKEFTFDSAHQLTDYYGKCERMHGHTYKLQVTLEGEVQKNGLMIDFVVLKRIVKKHVLDKLDHHVLNDVVDNPSAENLVVWIWDQLKDLQSLLNEEASDPNLAEHIKKLLKEKDRDADLAKVEFDKALRLYEIKLWETPNSWITYNGK